MVESAGNAPASPCLQGKCIACLPRPHENWQAALVLPQASWVLETRLHKLVRGLRELKIGAAAGSCARMVAVRKDRLGEATFCC